MKLKGLTRETYAVINLDYLQENYRNLKSYLGNDIEITCVIKADAYGHGSVEIARTLIECGVKYLAVACLSEALLIRKHFEKVHILVMGNIPDEQVKVALEKEIIFTVYDLDQALVINREAKALGISAVVHLKCDTGFNRLGFEASDSGLDQMAQVCQCENIHVKGLFSHLALRDSEADEKQYSLLMYAKEKLASWGYVFDHYHMCDSIAAVEEPQYRLNMVRPGAILYGLESHKGEGPKVRQIMTLYTRLSRVKWLKAGESVSYGGFTADKATLIGTIPIGYADGYPRRLTNRSKVVIDGKLYPQVGRTCMDQSMVDLTGSANLKRGDAVTLYSDDKNSGISITDIAKWGETNKNEIVARLSKRVPRVYVKNNEVYKIIDDLMGIEI